MKKTILLICLVTMAFISTGCSFVDDVFKQDSKSEIIDTFEQNKTLFALCIEEVQDLYASYERQTMRIRLSEDGSVFLSCSDPYPAETEKIETTIDSPNLQELLSLPTVKTIMVRKNGIEFAGEGSGIGSNTSYCGIFFTPVNDMTFIPYYDDDMLFTEENGIVYGSERNGDNSVHIERIEEDYFYYEANF